MNMMVMHEFMYNNPSIFSQNNSMQNLRLGRLHDLNFFALGPVLRSRSQPPLDLYTLVHKHPSRFYTLGITSMTQAFFCIEIRKALRTRSHSLYEELSQTKISLYYSECSNLNRVHGQIDGLVRLQIHDQCVQDYVPFLLLKFS